MKKEKRKKSWGAQTNFDFFLLFFHFPPLFLLLFYLLFAILIGVKRLLSFHLCLCRLHSITTGPLNRATDRGEPLDSSHRVPFAIGP